MENKVWKIEKLENKVAELQLEVNDLKRSMDVQTQLLHQVLDLLVTPHAPLSQHHSSRKRKRGVEVVPSEDLTRPNQVGSIPPPPHSAITAFDPTVHDISPEFDNSISFDSDDDHFENLLATTQTPVTIDNSVPDIHSTTPFDVPQSQIPIQPPKTTSTDVLSFQKLHSTSRKEISTTKIIATPLYVESLANISIAMILRDYYEFQLHQGRYGNISRANRARIKTVVDFMKQFMTKEQLDVMLNISLDFEITTQKKNISQSIAQLAMAELMKLEKLKQPIEPLESNGKRGRKKPDPKDTVTAFEKRLSNLKEKK